MALSQLIRIFQTAKEYANLNLESRWPHGAPDADQFKYHRTIVLCGKCGGFIGLVLGIAAAIAMYEHPRNPTLQGEDIFMICVTPLMTVAAGLLAGACWAGTFAPDSFLESPIGLRWRQMFRAQNLNGSVVDLHEPGPRHRVAKPGV
jgi:hypothetical protein